MVKGVRKKRWKAEAEHCQGSDQHDFSEHIESPLLNHSACWKLPCFW